MTNFRFWGLQWAFPVLLVSIGAFSFRQDTQLSVKHQNTELKTGADQISLLAPMLCDKQVALVVNQTSMLGNTHLADTLFSLGICVSRIFAPEHGFRGLADAGETIKDGQDMRTGIPIGSLYGVRKKPSHDDLEGIDVVVFDIQDVGARFYTYISTLFYVMEACAEHGKTLIVLDRPNPNGHYVDGPVLDMRYASFIGIAPLPIVHGCTVGELAQLFKGEHWINKAHDLSLKIIPCQNYTHQTPYDLPVKPSPNLPNMRAILLYPSLCLFEGTNFSLGRGTDWPFQVVGSPENYVDTFTFVPRPNEGNKKPFLEGYLCKGRDFTGIHPDSIRRDTCINLRYLLETYERFPNKPDFFLKNRFFDRLAGHATLRKQIEQHIPESEIRASWQPDLDAFKAIRKKYLLYP